MLLPFRGLSQRQGGCRGCTRDVSVRSAVPWRDEFSFPSSARRPGRRRKGPRRSAKQILEALLGLGPHPPQAAVFSACRFGLASWERNPKAATTVLAGLAKHGRWDVALKVIRFMQHHDLEVNCFHFTSAISACEKRGKWEIALALLGGMKQQEVYPSQVTYNAAISACAKGGEWLAALQLLKELRLDGTMDSVSYNAASSACAAAGLWNSSLSLLHDMYKSTVPPNVISFSTLLSACEKAQQWRMASHILFGMPAQSLMPDKICYTAVISACEKMSEWEQALACFGHMEIRTVEKDEICFHSAISACIRARAWSKALSLALDMEAVPLQVNGILWGGVASAMQQSGGPVIQLTSWLCRDWAQQNAQNTQNTSRSHTQKAGGAGEHEVHVLCQGHGVLAAFKPTGLSTEAALQRLSHLLGKEGHPVPLSRASRLDGATSGVMPVALGESGSPASNWLNYQFAARMADWRQLEVSDFVEATTHTPTP
ncbi:unnamed protein product [Symbiodinium natans]|uniref:Pentatricopeptide repeat-containing protein, chloroplastic n=1 Tax=Symbiodinium natans TaxID=878477 RepID=A0A812JW41_9DINO|nr:unnamed protein product [Symbiodinium natans]